MRGGVFAAQLAQLGMTGPDAPFEGKDGLADVESKFATMAEGVLAPHHQSAIRDALANIEHSPDVNELLSVLTWAPERGAEP